MPSILDQTFRYKLKLNRQHSREIERYCETQIGGRTYYLNRFRGGKNWRIDNVPVTGGNQVEVSLDDDSHATILGLRFS